MLGENRDALCEFLRRAIGHSLTGDTTEDLFFIAYGRGRNGKTTFLNTIRALLGDYSKQADAGTFLRRKQEGGPREDLVVLRGARFVPAVETDEGQRLAEALVKALTGGESLSTRGLYGHQQEFRPTFKIWLATNHRPLITGTDLAVWRRIRLVPFLYTVPEETQDPHLEEKLREELPGILAWAVRGCLAWQRSGLPTPQPVREATADYRAESDPVGNWLDECCEVAEGTAASAHEVYHSYVAWARNNGDTPLLQRGFANRLRERGFASEKKAGFRWWNGLALRGPRTNEDQRS